MAVFPFLWTLWGSFKVQGDFFSKADWTYAVYGIRTFAETGGSFTGNGYSSAWINHEFWRSSINTSIVVFFVVLISLTIGTLGGYALARSGYRYAFWLLMLALVFRAMPHITLVSGYLLPFFQWNLWGHLSTTIIVLVAINQPFTLWMLHSFFLNIPKELDEAALIDGANHFQMLFKVFIPVAMPGLIAATIFAFTVSWAGFLYPLAFIYSESEMVLTVGTVTTLIKGDVFHWGGLMAGALLAAAPPVIIYAFLMDYYIAGLTSGATKG